MKIHIFDVEHGECSAIETPSGQLILIGAGHNGSTGWRPSTWVREKNQQPTCIVLTNLDRDHLSDLPNFEPHLRPLSIVRNKAVEPQWLRNLKIQESGFVHSSVETAAQWMGIYNGPPLTFDPFIEIRFFWHPTYLFQDTNNLSVVTFVRYNECGVMFPGDLECAGWKAFLDDQEFVACLRNTNILIASHHGREGGYCADIFGHNHCNPHAVIISDKGIVHDTQDHDLYSQHCAGLTFGGNVTRRVLTTRNDGKITIDIPQVGGYTVNISPSYQMQQTR